MTASSLSVYCAHSIKIIPLEVADACVCVLLLTRKGRLISKNMIELKKALLTRSQIDEDEDVEDGDEEEGEAESELEEDEGGKKDEDEDEF